MWQSRVYAFIFRTVLGPYLTTESRGSLHKSLNISLSEGRLELFDIELDGDVVSRKLNLNLNNGGRMIIDKIHIQRLRILLSICYFDEYGNQVDSYDDGKVRLIAHVDMDGVMMEFSMSSFVNEHVGMTNKSQESEKKTSSSRSYFQSALDSLKLNLNMNNVTIRVRSESNSWISLNVASVTYHDTESRQVETSDPLPDMLILSKHVCIDTVTITVGTTFTENCASEELLRLDGQILINVTAKSREAGDIMNIERNADIVVNEVMYIVTRMETIDVIHGMISSFLFTKNGIASKECVQSPPHDSSSNTNEYDGTESESDSDDCINNAFFSRYNDESYMNHFGLSQHQKQLDCVEDDDVPTDGKDIFTTNGPGFSHYHSLVASINADENESSEYGMISTFFHVYLGSIQFSFSPKENLFSDEAAEEYQEYLACSIDQFDFLSKSGSNSQSITTKVSCLSIDYVFDDIEGQKMLPILGFPRNIVGDDHDDALISDPIAFVVTIHDTYDIEDEGSTRFIHASIQPVCITLWKSIFMNIASELHKMPPNTENAKSADNGRVNEQEIISTTCEIECEHVSLRLPIEQLCKESSCNNALFSRCGYYESQDIQVAFLAMDIHKFELHLVDFGVGRNIENEDLTVKILCQEAVGYVADNTLRFDIFSLESETKIDSNAHVKIEWMKSKIQSKSERFKKDRIRTIFPSVVLLSTVKTSQGEDEKEQYDVNTEEWNMRRKKSIRASDPSREMMRSASKSEGILILHIPSIAVDISKVERTILMKLLVFLTEHKSVESYQFKDSSQNPQSTLSVNVQCDQITLTVHEENVVETSLDTDGYSFMIVADSFRCHSMFENGNLMQVRALFSDLTLYEGENHTCFSSFNTMIYLSEDFIQLL